MAYGYVTPTIGYTKPPVTPQRSLASAAAGAANPFGLPGNTAYAMLNPAKAPIPPAKAPVPNALGSAVAAKVAPQNAALATANPVAAATAPTSAAVYDLNTDPALQQTLALTGKSDEEATAAAATARRNLLLNYGDPTLANAVLGDPTLASAAAANPTSTLAQLSQQNTQGLQTLEEQLNQANLTYSGYRTTQETKAAQDYQNALAAAASGVDTSLQGVQSSLDQALGANSAQRAQAASDAWNSALLAALANPPVAPTSAAPGELSFLPSGVPVDLGAAATGGGATLTPAQIAALRAAQPKLLPAVTRGTPVMGM